MYHGVAGLLLQIVLSAVTIFERHNTHTGHQRAVALKVFLAAVYVEI